MSARLAERGFHVITALLDAAQPVAWHRYEEVVRAARVNVNQSRHPDPVLFGWQFTGKYIVRPPRIVEGENESQIQTLAKSMTDALAKDLGVAT